MAIAEWRVASVDVEEIDWHEFFIFHFSFSMKYFITVFSILICTALSGQSQTKRALFLGNSYIYVNDLPQMVANVAISTGDTLLFDGNTPGGYTLQGHSTDATSLAKIAMGNWDYVVLQEQSQRPAFSINQVVTEVFPYAHILDSLINAANPCGETVFYMTWGRKNGDAANCASWPPVCTYAGMDSLLNLRYRMMADSNHAIVSPVGAVWKYIRQNFPLIELYQSDESHPSVAGTYAAACSFYTALFRKDPTLITFDAALSAADAANIRAAAKLTVYDSLMNWHIGEYDPIANFTYQVSGINQITFENSSANATDFYWDFGDNDTATSVHSTHLYLTSGSYTVHLIAAQCGISDTIYQTVDIASVGINEIADTSRFAIFPNPSIATITIHKNLTCNLSYKICSLSGQIVQTGNVSPSDNEISVAALSDGVYFLQLFDSNKPLGQLKFVRSSP